MTAADSTSNILENSNGTMKTVKLGSFLTNEQIENAIACETANEICMRVVRPNISEINKKIGQSCDPMYISYMLEYTFKSLKTEAKGA